MSEFKELGLLPEIISALDLVGYTKPTHIQAQAIPLLLHGKDLLGIAQTGTGKTAAFTIPLLDHLGRNSGTPWPSNTRSLILAPTRELASQIYESLKSYGKNLSLNVQVIFGGVPARPQIMAMKKGVDVLVATPGRLMDLMGQGVLRLDQVEVFILDEADRMLDMGFIDDIRKISAQIPAKRQTMLFSATMPSGIEKLTKKLLKNPAQVQVTPQATAVNRIDQKIIFVKQSYKTSHLKTILTNAMIKQAVVFCKTKQGADQITRELNSAKIQSEAIHGDKSQQERDATLNSFRAEELKVLIATDVAARGLDVEGVSHVINYDLPLETENYIHRIGRTARAGRTGMAIAFCDEHEYPILDDIEELLGFQIPEAEIKDFRAESKS